METKASIPSTTIETLARNFFKEASTYGFKQEEQNYMLVKHNIIVIHAADG